MVNEIRFYGLGTDKVRVREILDGVMLPAIDLEIPEGQRFTGTLMAPDGAIFPVTAEYGAVDDDRWAIGIVGEPAWGHRWEVLAADDTTAMLTIDVPDRTWLGRIIIR